MPQCPDAVCECVSRLNQVSGETIALTLDIQIKRLDGKRVLLSPEGRDLVLPTEPKPQSHIVEAIGLAYRWHEELIKTGDSISAVARRHGVNESRVRKLLPLTHLGPTTLRHALVGTLPPSVTLDDLHRAAGQLSWAHQLCELGIESASESSAQ